jgi:hypothetical protein
MAVSCQSNHIKINVSYREIPVSAPDPKATLAPYFQMAALTKKADFRNSKTGYVIF